MNKQTVIQWLKYVAIAAISFFLLLFVLGGLIFGYYAMKAPTLSEKDLVATTSSKIYDNQNNLIADLGAEKRINVSTDQIPTDLVNAIVAIEDHRLQSPWSRYHSDWWLLPSQLARRKPRGINLNAAIDQINLFLHFSL